MDPHRTRPVVSRSGVDLIRYVFHPHFEDPTERRAWAEGGDQPQAREFDLGHMPDEITRALSMRMHYAAHRMHKARRSEESQTWKQRYFTLRDRIILGNRKLIFTAVRKKSFHHQSDDLIGECYLVMIRAVAAFNPWIGIRFSTYAFTCLLRALTRLNQRSMNDRLAHHLTLDQLLGEEPAQETAQDNEANVPKIDQYLKAEHPLLTPREKTVIRCRYRLAGPKTGATLETVGKSLGISKERVRQVQASALGKLRVALSGNIEA